MDAIILQEELTLEQLQKLLGYTGKGLSILVREKKGNLINVDLLVKKEYELSLYAILGDIRNE